MTITLFIGIYFFSVNTVAKELVIKAMILAGGRGKGTFDSGLKGGVHLTKDPSTVPSLCKEMIGYKLTTKQTPPGGVKVNKVMILMSNCYTNCAVLN